LKYFLWLIRVFRGFKKITASCSWLSLARKYWTCVCTACFERATSLTEGIASHSLGSWQFLRYRIYCQTCTKIFWCQSYSTWNYSQVCLRSSWRCSIFFPNIFFFICRTHLMISRRIFYRFEWKMDQIKGKTIYN
jgi:hypothetical protein